MESRKTSYLVPLLALCALLLSAGLAQAQVTYQLTSTPTFVINTGRAEVLGNVRITALNAGPRVASTVQVLYQGVACDNTPFIPSPTVPTTTGVVAAPASAATLAATGMTIFVSGAYTTANVRFSQTTPVANTSAGCVVSIVVDGGAGVTNPTPTALDFIELGGVRGRVDFLGGITNVGQNVFASMNATPSNSSLFTAPTTLVVGTTGVGLNVLGVTPGAALICLTTFTNPIIAIQEGFNGAFVHHIIGTSTGSGATLVTGGLPANPRPLFAGINNTQVRFVVSGLPTGLTLAWPTAVPANAMAPYAPTTAMAGSRLVRLTTSTATSQTYEYQCGDQALCDVTQESFTLVPVVSVNIPTLQFGSATIQVRLFPDLIPGDATLLTDGPFVDFASGVSRPRFNDPLRPTPAATLIVSGPCATNLLYPFVANVVGFDSGIAIANTSRDPFGPLLSAAAATLAQAGTCTVTGWPANGVGLPAVSFTTRSIPAGDTFSTTLSSGDNPVFNGFVGYIIARCNFQYGHGFAFIQDGFGLAAPRIAEGYVALVIPDPVVIAATFAAGATTPGRRPQTAGPAAGHGIPNEGEGLAH